MRSSLIVFAVLFASSSTLAQHPHQMPVDSRPVTLMSGLGRLHHPVSTKNPEAQKFFEQGLLLLYAFNHAESIRSFQRAAELDPDLAMAQWGIALALGPNINSDVDPAREKAAFEAVQKALSMKAPLPERAYIEALAKRYSIDPNADLRKLSIDYHIAMRQLFKSYPDDLDAATLYAESGMDLRPWKLWSKDGSPAEGTEELISVLESVLRRNPDHVGANHYYIHVVEASRHPEWAIPSADRLTRTVKTAGHLVHMPSHIYMRVGDYELAASSNKDASKVDREYIEANNIKGMYAAGYYSHNLHFLAIANSMQGKFHEALTASDQLSDNVKPYLADIPSLESFLPTSTLVLVRFRKWDELLKTPQPPQQVLLTSGIWHWSRAMAYAAKGQKQAAQSERELFRGIAVKLPKDTEWGLNRAVDIFAVASKVLDAKLDVAEGDTGKAIAELTEAVALEDAFAYDEPPAWFLPTRECLGGVLLRAGKFEEAEQVFRADLERNSRNPRSLFGLVESLKAQNKNDSVQMVQSEFDQAWKNADEKLNDSDL
jgi:tetratricopeptide (TPR) repeat protein